MQSRHSLQETNVPGNVLIVDHHVKKKIIYIFTRTVRKDLNAISDKNKT